MKDHVMILGEVFAARRLDVHYSAATIRVYRNDEIVHIHQLNVEKETVRANIITVNNTSSHLKDGMTINAEQLRRYLNNQPIEMSMHTKIVDKVEKPNSTFDRLFNLDAFEILPSDGRVYMKVGTDSAIIIKDNSRPENVGMHRGFGSTPSAIYGKNKEVKPVDLTLVVG